MPVITKSQDTVVVNLQGEAYIRRADGKLHLLKLGDKVSRGDLILTAQNGWVELVAAKPEADDPLAQMVASKPVRSPLDNELNRVIEGLAQGNPDVAPAAGGTNDEVAPALRIDRISEGVSPDSLRTSGLNGGAVVERLAEEQVLPTLSISGATASETAGFVTFTIALASTATQNVTVNYQVLSDTALAGVDFSALSGTVTIVAGTNTAVVQVPINDDSVFEGPETLLINLSNPTNATLGTASAVGVIADNEGTPTVTLISTPSAAEGNPLAFDVQLSNASSTATTLPFGLGGGSAGAADFGAPVFSNGVTLNADGSLNIPAGVTRFTVTVPTVSDGSAEGAETLPLRVGGTTANGTISDNAAAPTLDLDADNSTGATGTGANARFTENGTPVGLVDTDVRVSDADSATLAGATLSLANPQAGDVLSVGSLPAGISASISGTTVTLSGNATPAAYAAALQAVSLTNTSDNPSALDRLVNVTVTDGASTSNVAVATVQVVAVNDAPVANPDLASTGINTPIPNIAVLSNDSDVDGGSLSVTGAVLANPALGTVSVNPDGTLNFSPAANITGPVVITYTVSDGQGGSTLGTLTVNVGTNTPPTGQDATLSLAEDSSRAFSPADFGFVDADAGQTLAAVRIDTLPAAGSLNLNGVPVMAGQAMSAADLANLSFTPAPNANGNAYASFSFSVQDSAGSFDTAPNTITLNVTPVADPAVIGGVNSGATVEDTTLSTSGTLTVSDPDASEATFVPQTAVAGAHGSFTLAADGNWTYTLNNADPAVQALGTGQSLPSETFTVRTLDGTPATVTVSITGTNDGPQAAAASVAVTEDAALFSGRVTATDPDAGAALGFALNSAPPAGLVFNADGSYSFNPADAAYQSLAAGQQQVLSIPYTVTDDQGATSVATLTITVVGTNDAAVIGGTASGTVTEDGTVLASGTLSVSDVDGASSFQVGSSVGTYGDFAIAADGSWSYVLRNADANVQALKSTDAPVESFTVRAADGTTATVTVTVRGANEAPTAVASPASGAEDAASIPVTLGGTDVDGNVDRFTVGSLPANGTLLFDGKAVTVGQEIDASGGTANLTFVPSADWNGTTRFDFSAVDNEGVSSPTVQQEINVAPVNDAPIANPDAANTPINTPLINIPVLGNDSDVDGDRLSVTSAVLATPALGTVSINADGTLNFSPALNVSGPVVITYTLSDGQGGTSRSTLTVNVGTNTPPTGQDTTVTLAEDSSRPFSAADFGFADTDVGQTLAAVRIDTLPAAGSLRLNGVPVTAGQVINAADLANLTFTPAANDSGNGYASFSFSVRDSADAFDTAPNTITVNVTAVADPALINGRASGATVEDTTLVASGTLTVTDPDAGEAAFVPRTAVSGAHGSFTMAADGRWTYTLNNADPAVQALGAGETLPNETFTVRTIDGTPATVTVTITGTNDGPVAQAASFTVAEDAALVSGAVVGTDIDANATLTYALNIASPPGLVFNADGSYSFNPADAAYQSLGAGQSAVLTVPYTVTDDQGASSTANLVITVTGTNDAPVAQAASFTVAEDAPVVSGAVVGTDTDANATLTYALNSAAPAGLLFNADGSYSFNPAAAAYQSLGVGQSAVLTVPYTVTDDQGASSTANLVITVTGTNDAPVAQAASFTVAEDAAVVSGAVVGTDIDANATLSYALNAPPPAGLVFNADGSYSFNPADAAYQSLGAGQQRVLTIPYTVTDDQGATSIATLTITVLGTNDAPVVASDLRSITEDSAAITGNVLRPLVVGSGDRADTDPEGDTLTVSGVSASSGTTPSGGIGANIVGTYGTLVMAANGNYTYTPSGAAQSLKPGETANDVFTYAASDGKGGVSATTLTVRLTGNNDAPVITSDGGRDSAQLGVTENTTFVTTVAATDPDRGATLTYSISGGADAARFTINPTTGALSFKTAPDFEVPTDANGDNRYLVQVTVTDEFGATDTQTLTVFISNQNETPVASADVASVAAGGTIDVTAANGVVLSGTNAAGRDTDPDGDPLTVDRATAGAATPTTTVTSGGTVINGIYGDLTLRANGSYTYVANKAAAVATGTTVNDVFSYRVSDGLGEVAFTTLTVQVAGRADNLVAPPAVTRPSTAQGLNGEYYGYNDTNPTNTSGNRQHSDDGTVGNLDRLSDISTIINGRNVASGGANVVGTNAPTLSNASDARFISNGLDYGFTPIVNTSLGTNVNVAPGASTSSLTNANSQLFAFLNRSAGSDAGSLVVTSGTGDNDALGTGPTAGLGSTTDAIVRLSGFAYTQAGTYDIRVTADDGFRLSIGGNVVAFFDGNQAPTARTFTGVSLSEGLQSLELLYWEQGINARLRVELKVAGEADSTYRVLGSDVVPLFASDPGLTELQDIVNTGTATSPVWSVRTGSSLSGDAGNDILTGSAGRDVLNGGADIDELSGGGGRDALIGGAGNDQLTGGLGSDVFRWQLADRGIGGTPARDTITDFDARAVSAGGDVLDLRDLLQGETNATLGNYLDFQYDSAAGATVVRVSSTGGFTGGTYSASAEDQRITLQGVDLRSALGLGASATDDQILSELLNRNKLTVGP